MRLKTFQFTLILILLSGTLWGQPGDPPTPVPITGIEWLLLAGGALGLKKLHKKFKK